MYTIGEIISATRGRVLGSHRKATVSGVSTDSRTINPGDLFIPLEGKKFDGHAFINKAFERGASCTFVSSRHINNLTKKNLTERLVIIVDDTLKALQELASMHRRRYNIPVIAITGSNGKTTTKEMAYSILKKDLITLKNEGNINNHIGVPLTIFNLSAHHQAFLVEMGISLKGEMRKLCQIALPTIGLITNIGPTHLETLGSVEGVASAKWELAEFIVAAGGRLMLNADNHYLARLIPDLKGSLLTYGIDSDANIRGLRIGHKEGCGESFTIKRHDGEIDIVLKLFGRHNIYNALAAAAIATHFNLRLDEIKSGLEEFAPVPMRSETIRLKKGTMVINDSYNANPASMRCAISTITALKGKGMAIAVLGDMLELGNYSKGEHLDLGKFAAKSGIDRLILFGEMASQIQEGAKDAGMNEDNIKICYNRDDISRLLIEMAGKDDIILVKGSRGMRLETVVKELLTLEVA